MNRVYHSEAAYKMFMTHLDDLREVYESLIDEQSKKTFCGYWLGRTTTRLGDFVYSNAPHYLISGFVPQEGGIVIEAGAFDGGTAAVFADMGYKVHTFEMDKINYERTRKVAEEKNFVVENCGLGSFKHVEHYNSTDKNFSKLTGNGKETVEIIKMDAYVREKKLPRVDMIKLDVEGAELDILRGAAMTITCFKPILALSAYHKLDDFWTLMNFVKSIRPDYEFAMRHSYEIPEEEPNNFSEQRVNYLLSLGLEVASRSPGECVLFAR